MRVMTNGYYEKMIMLIMMKFEKIYIHPSQEYVNFLRIGMQNRGVSHYLELMEME